MAKRKRDLMVHFTAQECAVLSAMFARSNTGLPRATPQDVRHLLDKRECSTISMNSETVRSMINDAVGHLLQEYIESDEHERAFVEEAEMWYARLAKDGVEKTARVHPELVITLREAQMAVEFGKKLVPAGG